MKLIAYSVREDEFAYFHQFSEQCHVECKLLADYPCMENLREADGYDAVSIITNVITPEMYQIWKDMGVRSIATRSVGYDHLDVLRMKELGIRGIHATYSPNAVANYAIMLMLMACRKVNYILEHSRMQDFALPGKAGRELSLCTVGVIGTGAIGETVIRHLSGFGCRILACDTYEKDTVRQYAEYVSLDTILRECDVISLHVPGLAANRHMIDSDAIAKMKDGVIIINTARGTLIDSHVLIDGLTSGKVGFAALDTYEEEFGLYYKNLDRTILNDPVRAILSAFPNVILSPHMAFYTDQSTSDMVGTSCRGLLDLALRGESDHEISYTR